MNVVNPIVKFIESKEWDGIGRLKPLAATLQMENEENRPLLHEVLELWALEAVAAAYGGERTINPIARPEYPYVLVLQGDQGVRKSSWFLSLLPKPMQKYIKTGVFLDPSNVDSICKATSYWICELGEIGSTFRRADIDRLKAFLAESEDVYRLPYARTKQAVKRQTAFCGSVNEVNFLTDLTGARRFYPVAVTALNTEHGINMQQFWAEMAVAYKGGKAWWPSEKLEKELIEVHEEHAQISTIEDDLGKYFDMDCNTYQATGRYNCTEMLRIMGLVPDKAKCNELAKILRKKGFKIRTRNKRLFGIDRVDQF
jgi:putative DNA primase/helicase